MAKLQRSVSPKKNNRDVGGWGYLLLGVATALLLGGCMETPAPTLAGDVEKDLAVGLAMDAAGFSDVQVAGGLSNPTLMAIAPDGRIFVSEQAPGHQDRVHVRQRHFQPRGDKDR